MIMSFIWTLMVCGYFRKLSVTVNIQQQQTFISLRCLILIDLVSRQLVSLGNKFIKDSLLLQLLRYVCIRSPSDTLSRNCQEICFDYMTLLAEFLMFFTTLGWQNLVVVHGFRVPFWNHPSRIAFFSVWQTVNNQIGMEDHIFELACKNADVIIALIDELDKSCEISSLAIKSRWKFIKNCIHQTMLATVVRFLWYDEWA